MTDEDPSSFDHNNNDVRDVVVVVSSSSPTETPSIAWSVSDLTSESNSSLRSVLSRTTSSKLERIDEEEADDNDDEQESLSPTSNDSFATDGMVMPRRRRDPEIPEFLYSLGPPPLSSASDYPPLSSDYPSTPPQQELRPPSDHDGRTEESFPEYDLPYHKIEEESTLSYCYYESPQFEIPNDDDNNDNAALNLSMDLLHGCRFVEEQEQETTTDEEDYFEFLLPVSLLDRSDDTDVRSTNEELFLENSNDTAKQSSSGQLLSSSEDSSSAASAEEYYSRLLSETMSKEEEEEYDSIDTMIAEDGSGMRSPFATTVSMDSSQEQLVSPLEPKYHEYLFRYMPDIIMDPIDVDLLSDDEVLVLSSSPTREEEEIPLRPDNDNVEQQPFQDRTLQENNRSSPSNVAKKLTTNNNIESQLHDNDHESRPWLESLFSELRRAYTVKRIES